MKRGSFLVRKCALAGVEAIEATTGHVFSRHSHDAFGLGRILDGGQSSWSGRGAVEAHKGDMISSNPGEVHDGAPLGESRSWKMLYFDPAVIADLVLDLQEGHAAEFEFTTPVFGRTPGVGAFERCYASLTDTICEGLTADTAVVLLLASLLERAPKRGPAPSERLCRARERIDSDPVATLSLEELARDAGVSRYQALRGFTRLTGLPPHAYQVQRRLEMARRMIASGSGLSDAASACGFADQSHLHRTFVRRFGVTPGAYSRALR